MKNEQTLGIVDKSQSSIIRAICCIIVILVHVPQQHGNFIQDAIGSFGYIAVTLFFMLSAYGLKYSVENKKDYIKHFWRNRILVLLIPFWLVNIIAILIKPQTSMLDNVLAIIGLKNISFITVLLVYYILFWMVYRFIKNEKIKDYILCAVILLYAILGKIFNLSNGWFVESMGLMYGVLIYYMIPKLKKIDSWKDVLIFGIISIILGVIYIKFKMVYMFGTYFLRTLLGISIILFFTAILNKVTLKSRVLTALGGISYEVYLVHNVITNLIFNLDAPSYLWIFLEIILSIFTAIIIHCIDREIINRIKLTSNL